MEIPDLNDTRIFVAVGQEGTLSSAARKLDLPTSTISRALTRLEKSLDTLLIQRNTRGFTLTESGKEYLQTCRRALRTLEEGREVLESKRSQPRGLISIACPVTMLRTLFGPLVAEFLEQHPGLRMEINPYCSDWNQEPGDDVDILFKVRAPKDSRRRVRWFPGVARGTFASPKYLAKHEAPRQPDELSMHSCIGSGSWKLTRKGRVADPKIDFRIQTSDPYFHLDLALRGAGIAILPLYMTRWPKNRARLVQVLEGWVPEPMTLCALFSGPSKLTPKIGVFLNFLSEYIGTERDPRLRGITIEGLFTPPAQLGKSGR